MEAKGPEILGGGRVHEKTGIRISRGCGVDM